MTLHYLRDPRGFRGAVALAVEALGAARIAAELGVHHTRVYDWTQPHSERWPSIQQAAALDRLFVAAGFGPGPILEVFKALVGAPERGVAPATAVLRLSGELGDVARAIEGAERDGRWTPNERAPVARELTELRGQVDLALAGLAGPARLAG